MISENKNQDNERTFRGLENEVPQNHGLSRGYQDKESDKNSDDEMGKPVDIGGVNTTLSDPQLEEQWLAVCDEYLAHYPDLDDTDTEYKKGNFYAIIKRLAKRRQRTPKEIHNEIMDWSSTK